MKKGNLLFALTLGILLIPNAVESKCTCKAGKIINDFCCESAHTNTKDACCHVDGLKNNPPNWVPDGPDPGPQPTPEPPVVPTPEPPVVMTEVPIVPPDECSKPGDECENDNDCPGTKLEYCKCAACHCVCDPIDTAKCGEDAVCKKDEDCRGGLGEDREACKCADCVCDCKMSPDGCSDEEECRTDQDCEKMMGDDEVGYECNCQNCECFCDIADEEAGPVKPTGKETRPAFY